VPTPEQGAPGIGARRIEPECAAGQGTERPAITGTGAGSARRCHCAWHIRTLFDPDDRHGIACDRRGVRAAAASGDRPAPPHRPQSGVNSVVVHDNGAGRSGTQAGIRTSISDTADKPATRM